MAEEVGIRINGKAGGWRLETGGCPRLTLLRRRLLAPAVATLALLALAVSSLQAADRAADNSRCLVCHLNFKQESLATAHAKAGLGCVKCHGESDAHASDEDNVTAPDIMYAKRAVNPACIKCHALEKLGRKAHVPAAAPQSKRVCTGCHGPHRAANRSRRWDPETRKLIDR